MKKKKLADPKHLNSSVWETRTEWQATYEGLNKVKWLYFVNCLNYYIYAAINLHLGCTCRTVLELGSGIGLTGIVVCRSSSLTKYIFSDCHQTVLQRLKDNITNCLTNSDSNSASVSVEELHWENVSDEQLQRIQANTIIAAGDTKHVFCILHT